MSRPFRRRLNALDPNKDGLVNDNLTFTGTITFSNPPVLGSGTLVSTVTGVTSAELDMLDISAQTETVIAAGALSVTKKISKVALVGAGAVTLAAPDAALLGVIKIIEMTVDNGDVTLALTNVTGQSTGTTATFNDVGDALTLVGGVSKWHVLGEAGLGLA